MPTTIKQSVQSHKLLGAAMGPLDTWQPHIAVLQAAFGHRLTKDERAAFDLVAGGREPPSSRVAELWVVAGRRSGKSRLAAAVAAHLGAVAEHAANLAPGEVGQVLVLAATKAQAQAVFGYVHGFLHESPALHGLVRNVTAEEIQLHGNVSIAVHAANFRTVRSRTILACVFDETAFWRDESSANPDQEIYRAVLPSLASTGGMLIGISSPYRRLGLLYEKHRDHFGMNDDDVLVVQGPSTTWNSTLDPKIVERAIAADPEAALAEWHAEFRSDISSLLPDDAIDAAIDEARPLELEPQSKPRYHAFVDVSAGRRDAFCLCIGHMCDTLFVADVVRGRKPPFSVDDVVEEYADLCKTYGIRKVEADAFSGEWAKQAFENAGIEYMKAPLPKSGLYLEGLPSFMQNRINLPNVPQLIRELRLLERRTSRSGKDTVDHGTGGSDDYANVVFGALNLATRKKTKKPCRFVDAFADDAEGSTVHEANDGYPPAGKTFNNVWL